MKIEDQILEIIQGKKEAPVAKALLRVMSEAYRGGVFLKNAAYDHVLPKTRLKIPVISVGNIVAGGTGKTPVIEYLARALSPKKVAILSRGYRRKGKRSLLVKENTPVEECGDEPYMLFQKLQSADIYVGAKRKETGLLAQMMGADLILLDDGMQHRQLARDIEIGVMDASDLFGKGFFLPRGLLRDSPKRLAFADLIVVNGVQDEIHYEKIKALLAPITKAPICAFERKIKNREEVLGKNVGMFCAIANPGRFEKTLEGVKILCKREKGDHLPFSKEEIQELAYEAKQKGAEILVCTEKDAVKLPKDLDLPLPIVPVKLSLEPKFGKEHLKNLIDGVRK